MPSKKAPAAVASQPADSDGTVEVRALVTNEAHGLEAGELAVIDADLLAPLKAAGAVDDHPEAVAFAKKDAA